jgi:hypothetical protein
MTNFWKWVDKCKAMWRKKRDKTRANVQVWGRRNGK